MNPAIVRLRRLGGAQAVIALLACAAAANAGQTRTWSESEFADFDKGIRHGVSLRSDGLLSLAPAFRELYDTSATYLWALARDAQGNLYAGGGPGAKIYLVEAKGGHKVLAELDGLSVQALAVDQANRLYAATSPDGRVYRLSAGGKPEVFYDPKAKYIWAMAFDGQGNLFLATGDQGEIHRVTPAGKGQVFFKTRTRIPAASIAASTGTTADDGAPELVTTRTCGSATERDLAIDEVVRPLSR